MHSLLLTLTLIIISITTMDAQTLHTFSVKDIKGKTVDLSAYKGKVVLIVNVASFCGYTKQYAPLERLYRKYEDQGLVVLGFPANDFGAQEPGSEEEILEFCSTKYDVSFPMFSKVVVKGADKVPLFAWLTSGDGKPNLAGEIQWNFEKFLIGKDGHLITRFSTKVDPMSDEVIQAVQAAL
jgi:glutathione peroxidase